MQTISQLGLGIGLGRFHKLLQVACVVDVEHHRRQLLQQLAGRAQHVLASFGVLDPPLRLQLLNGQVLVVSAHVALLIRLALLLSMTELSSCFAGVDIGVYPNRPRIYSAIYSLHE